MKVEGSLGCSGQEMVGFRVLRGGIKTESRTTALVFRRADWTLQCLEKSDRIGPWRKEGSKKAGRDLKDQLVPQLMMAKHDLDRMAQHL